MLCWRLCGTKRVAMDDLFQVDRSLRGGHRRGVTNERIPEHMNRSLRTANRDRRRRRGVTAEP